MSSRPLLLVSGAPGAGTTTIAHALAASSDARVIASDVIAADGRGDAGSLIAGWDPVLEAVGGASTLRTADALLAAVAAMEAAGAHVGPDEPVGGVVWDAGPVDTLLADLATLDLAAGLVHRVAGPLVSWALSARAERLDTVRDLGGRISAGLAVLRSPMTRIVVVDEPTPGLRARIVDARARLELLGLPLDLVVVNRVPRPRDGWPKAWARDRRRRAHALDDELTIRRVRWFADDASASRLARRIAKRLPGIEPDAMRMPLEPRVETIRTPESEDRYALHVPLPHSQPASVAAGRLGDDLVVEVAGLRRVHPLPPVLTRCRVEGGGIVGDDLVIRFAPDPRQWRSAS